MTSLLPVEAVARGADAPAPRPTPPVAANAAAFASAIAAAKSAPALSAAGATPAFVAAGASPAGAGAASLRGNLAGSSIADDATIGEKFEAQTLASFIGELLPANSSPIWGGSAGTMWRGLYAEKIADEMARHGGIGIARTIDRKLPPTEDRP